MSITSSFGLAIQQFIPSLWSNLRELHTTIAHEIKHNISTTRDTRESTLRWHTWEYTIFRKNWNTTKIKYVKSTTNQDHCTWFTQILGLRPPKQLLHIIFIAKGYNPRLPYRHTLCFVLLLNSLAESTSKLYIPTLGISSSILPFKMFKTKKYNPYA